MRRRAPDRRIRRRARCPSVVPPPGRMTPPQLDAMGDFNRIPGPRRRGPAESAARDVGLIFVIGIAFWLVYVAGLALVGAL